MEYVSIFEARLRTGVSEVTIRRAIKSGKVAVKAISLQPGEQYLIPVEELEKLKSRDDYALISQRLGRVEERIDTLYELLAAHDFRIKQLEEQVRNLKNVQTPAQSHQERATKPVAVSPSNYTPTRDKATSAPRVTRQSAIPEMPPGTLSLQEFSDVLGIARRTLLEQVVKYDLPHTALESNRPGELKRYFDSEQQEAVKQWRAERGL